MYSDVIAVKKLERIFHLLCAFPLVLQEHIQGFRQPGALKGYLSADDITRLGLVTNRPFFITNKLAYEVRSIPDFGGFTSRERLAMLKYVDEISRSIGACERIVQTPVPLTYARHTSRFLSLWCLTLPMALVSELGWHIVPFTALVSWSLFGIQEIGMMIEEPFQRALKLEVFANTILRDLSDLLHVTDAAKVPLSVTSPALRYEPPAYQRVEPGAIDSLRVPEREDPAINPDNIRLSTLEPSAVEEETVRNGEVYLLRNFDPMDDNIPERVFA